jgi:hypothetical protein
MRRWVTPRSAVGTRLGMRLHGTDCASTAPIASARHRLRRHGTDCVGTAPIASAWHRLRRHGTDCVGMAPIASAWHRLRRHGTDCAGTAPIAPARHRLRRHGTDCAGTAPGDHHRPNDRRPVQPWRRPATPTKPSRFREYRNADSSRNLTRYEGARLSSTGRNDRLLFGPNISCKLVGSFIAFC